MHPGERQLRLRQTQLRPRAVALGGCIARIYLHQKIALAHPLIVFDQQFHHITGGFRSDGDRVAFGKGVIGRFLIAGGKPEPQADYQHDHHRQNNQRLFAGALAFVVAVIISLSVVILRRGAMFAIPVIVFQPDVVRAGGAPFSPGLGGRRYGDHRRCRRRRWIAENDGRLASSLGRDASEGYLDLWLSIGSIN